MRLLFRLLLPAVLWLAGCTVPPPGKDGNAGLPDGGGLRDAVILIIRHAEKSEVGPGLSAAGQAHVQGYIRYFQKTAAGSAAPKLSYVVAAADSTNSHRPRLTLQPLAQALGLDLELKFASQQSRELAQELTSRPHGKVILICWRHGKIPDLLQALGAKPNKLLPHGVWPEDDYRRAIELRYDQRGRLLPGGATLMAEGLE